MAQIQDLVQIKPLSCQATTLTMNQNAELAKFLLEEMKTHSNVTKNAKHYLGTLLLLLDPLLAQEDACGIKQKMQDKINQYKKQNKKIKTPKPKNLSNVPQPLFIIFGTLLPLKDSIKMRCLNKFFYQEFTNKQLIKRRQWNNDKYLTVDRSILHHIELGPPNSLKYQYPIATSIDLGVNYDDKRAEFFNNDLGNLDRPWFHNDRHKPYWNSFFEYCNDLWIQNGSINILEFIPISILFDKQNNTNNIDIYMSIYGDNVECDQSFHVFNTKYTEYLKNECNDCNDNIRTIDKLEFQDVTSHSVGNEITFFMETLKENFLNLSMVSCQLHIHSINQLNAVFHPKLQSLKLHNQTSIWIDEKLLIMDNIHNQCGNLRALYLRHCVHYYSNDTPGTILKNLTKLAMLNTVTQIEISLDLSHWFQCLQFLDSDGWLRSLLNSDDRDIQCPKIECIRIDAWIGLTWQCEMIIEQINYLNDIVKHIHNSVKKIGFYLTVSNDYNGANLRLPWFMRDFNGDSELTKEDIPLSNTKITQTLRKESIAKVCQWLVRSQKRWSDQQNEQLIQIEFECNTCNTVIANGIDD